MIKKCSHTFYRSLFAAHALHEGQGERACSVDDLYHTKVTALLDGRSHSIM